MPRCRFAPAGLETEFVYGACEPGFDHSVSTVDEWVSFVQQQGIERVLCLLQHSQLRDHDDLLSQYRAAFGTEAVCHVPVSDHRLVQTARLSDEILPVLDDSACQEEPIVVHCKAGIGRTGQTLAAWLVHRHGYAPEDAIQTVKKRYRRPDEAVQRGNARRSDLIRLLESVE